jgi:hypothetical protein
LMSLYLRKALSFGPLRINLSGGGIGASVGVTGARLGLSPRGVYVHAGRHGVYYRHFLNPQTNSDNRSTTPAATDRSASTPTVAPALEAITSGDVASMKTADSADFLQQLNTVSTRPQPLKPALAVAALVIVAGGILNHLLLAFAAGLLIAVTAWWLQLNYCTVALYYDLTPEVDDQFTRRAAALEALNSAGHFSHVGHAGATTDKKYEAGADTLIRRRDIQVTLGNPPGIRTNVQVPALDAGSETLYFFPDRLLVYAHGRYGAIGYDTLAIHLEPVDMIEQGAVPKDAQIVRRTWQYVNSKGGPDKRFKDNRELPVCRYQRATLTSPSGLREQFQWSRPDLGERLQQAFAQA